VFEKKKSCCCNCLFDVFIKVDSSYMIYVEFRAGLWAFDYEFFITKFGAGSMHRRSRSSVNGVSNSIS
jgi:hypothetical protein